MAYDEKYRGAAVEFKDSGHTFEELQEVFGVSNSTYYRWKTIKNTTGCYTQNWLNLRRENEKLILKNLKYYWSINRMRICVNWQKYFGVPRPLFIKS